MPLVEPVTTATSPVRSNSEAELDMEFRPFPRYFFLAGRLWLVPAFDTTGQVPIAYFHLIAANAPFLGFGLLLACFSSFGQTFYIGLFGAEIRSDFGLSHAEFGALYMTATLVSGAAFAFAGGLSTLSRSVLHAAVALLGLAIALRVMASAAGAVLLTVALCALRFFGQGLVTHTAHTATARHFDRDRARPSASSCWDILSARPSCRRPPLPWRS